MGAAIRAAAVIFLDAAIEDAAVGAGADDLHVRGDQSGGGDLHVRGDQSCGGCLLRRAYKNAVAVNLWHITRDRRRAGGVMDAAAMNSRAL